MTRTIAAIPAALRARLEDRLPDWIEPRWYASAAEACMAVEGAEICWIEVWDDRAKLEAIRLATAMKWLNSGGVGVDLYDLALLRERGVMFTNGAGVNAVTIAEYIVMGMLTIAKGYREVVHAQQRREWLGRSPGRRELFESKALLLGYGAIGQLVDERLSAFGVEVTKVRRNPGPGTLGPDQWRQRLGEFDWIVVTLPATPETIGIVGAAEIAAMKADAVVLNVGRGTTIDQAALTVALEQGRIGGAFLDVTTPEPLPADDPLWALDNAHITMHLSGSSQTRAPERAAERFLANLERYRKGEPLGPLVDLVLGY